MIRASILCASLFAVTACAGAPCPNRPFGASQSLLNSYRDARLPLRSLQAEARVDRRDPDSRVRGTVYMLVERPNRVRFDVHTQFGPAAVLTSDGETFALTDMRENRYFTGPTCPSNIERLLGLSMPAEDVGRFLFGNSPRIEGEARLLPCLEGRYRVVIDAADGARQELDYSVRENDRDAAPEEQRMRLRRSELFAPDGQTIWRVTYDDYRVIADPNDETDPRRGVALPFRIRLEEPARSVDTLVRMNDIEINADTPGDAFTQRPRPGLVVQRVSCE